ncbi:transcriptional regulator [Geminocystis sp. NIES-3708]|uniref:GntR family transcriptional regulator n=1 Tax=Geminocystis sp. NIES-3708 TaxID=1615909 RepID=UPI0005FCCCBF|nr:GntR family transcriptional regulator [Geminocystis sp. NIES-3708]BAQ60491.1 transcriptional regulator [Geminocystis sp. NIES-3708]
MFHFSVHNEGNIPPSQQLIDQIQFAIASRQYPPGHRLPSTRQLATITGLHRNTISKVYRQLEEKGLVESLPGSGIYVKPQGNESIKKSESHLSRAYLSLQKIVKENVDELLLQGCNLEQIKQLFVAEIDSRLRCNALVFVTVPMADIGAGQLIVLELEQALLMPIQLVPMEELHLIATEAMRATVVTSRYFIHQVLEIVSPQLTRVIPLDIYDYKEELQIIKKLPQDSYLGIVSLSTGILRVAEILVHSLRGKDITILTAQTNDQQKLKNLVRSAYTIICDPNSYLIVKKTLQQVQEDLIRPPEIICSNNYIGEKSINLLKRELGIN